MQTGDAHTAVAVLQITADTHPKSWNAYDSLGDGYETVHDNPNAIAAYRRRLESSDNGRDGKRPTHLTITSRFLSADDHDRVDGS
jgi:hypothetical protein